MPVTKRSGQQRVVHFRFACDTALRYVVDQIAFLSLRSCEWARAYYDQHRARDIPIVRRSGRWAPSG